MAWRRVIAVVGILSLVIAAGTYLASPRRYVVDGWSMAPGLLPGDVVAGDWLPLRGRLIGPRRFERWIVALPDGTAGLKRVVGLPGETVSIMDGDLGIDGSIAVKSPQLLAEIGSRVASETHPERGATAWTLPPRHILDEAPSDDAESSRLLLPVRDVGFTAIVTVPSTAGAVRVRAVVGALAITWRLTTPGNHAVVTGRLDGHAVAAAWLLPCDPDAVPARSCLPPGAPDRWDVVHSWPLAAEAVADDRSPMLSLDVTTHGPTARVELQCVTIWRDVLYRPAADGQWRWPLADGEVLLLGDFPSGSRDSRHFGPVPPSRLRHRVARAWTP